MTSTCGSLEWNRCAPMLQQFQLDSQNVYSYSYLEPYSSQGKQYFFFSIPTLRPPAFSKSVARIVSTQPKAKWNNLKCDFTLLYVLSDDSDMLVPVRTCVLMPETHHMAQLMSHNPKLVTVLSNGYGLRAPSSATHVGATPGTENKNPRSTPVTSGTLKHRNRTQHLAGLRTGQQLHTLYVLTCKNKQNIKKKVHLYKHAHVPLSVIPGKGNPYRLSTFWANTKLS